MRMDILIVEDQRRIAEGLSVMLSSCKEDGIQIERTLIADNGCLLYTSPSPRD